MKGIMAMLLFLMALSVSIYAEEVTFPKEGSFQSDGKNYQLQFTGEAARKKYFIKLYEVAHYLQNSATAKDKFQAVMDPTRAKQLTLKWVRDAPGDKVQEGYHISFKDAATESDAAQLKPQIDQYIGFFSGGVKKGDEQILRWIPGGQVDVIIDGKPAGTIKNEAFAKVLWSIWFGEHHVVDPNALVSQMK